MKPDPIVVASIVVIGFTLVSTRLWPPYREVPLLFFGILISGICALIDEQLEIRGYWPHNK